jgi:dihydrofolate synthase/folylpolyglutamate synthase
MSDAYQKALDYLYGFVNFEHRRMDKYTQEYINLERPEKFLAKLGKPYDSYPSIHIAGTKGKGSVAAFCASCLRQAGLTVGLYTSPHLQDFRDRIRVLSPSEMDGRISRRQVVNLTERLKPVVDRTPGLTWYEIVTAMAFLHFAESQVEVAVIEVGLGGRLDATNVLKPLVAVITSLSLDHTLLLGNSLVDIAREKGGIIKRGVPVISAPQAKEALEELRLIAKQRQAPLTLIGREWDYDPRQEPALPGNRPYRWRRQVTVTRSPEASPIKSPIRFELSLAGRHQQENAVIAVAALNEVWDSFPSLSVESVRKGLTEVDWPGRFQILRSHLGGPTILLDCAHNVDSAEKLAQALKDDFEYEKLWLIVGITADKDVEGIIKALLPLTEQAVLTASSHPRAAGPEELENIGAGEGYNVFVKQSVAESLEFAWKAAGPADLICVTGSIFVVADLLNEWEGLQSEIEERDFKLAPPVKSAGP